MTAVHPHDAERTGHAERVVVIGTGLAGTRLAQRLGGCGEDTVLIGEEAHTPYNRVLLAEVLAGTYGPDVIALPGTSGARLRTRAVRIDRGRRLVQCENGAEVTYDRLVLATGSNPVLPPLRGLFAPGATALPGGVYAFRTMDDCLALGREIEAAPGSRAVVVGGGLLGVSAARALARRGAQVVLVQQSERLMERQLDPRSSALVRRHLEALGVEIHTECRVRGVGVVEGRVRRVELHDGYVLGTDVTVLACGVRPRAGLAHAAGLAVRKGVVVDDELRTSDPRIHAVGDCAEHAGAVYGLATPALEQADALADLLTGGTTAYTGTRTLTRLTLPHEAGPLDLAAFGETEALPGDDVVQLTDATRGTYRKVVVRGDRLVGGVLVGELAAVGALAHAWESDESLPAGDDGGGAPLLHLLTHDGGL
ncbi:NAD(P)/FAD-dependent oxidoreductase [Streptomyces beihaiensis]|uniref:FAD-dependent oxidoreductase n=1 Tax=Streptomyces beihaiensis TaxID=2984495 RepID=A0ABT3TQC7_9ACTN|nr:FAD-dependent oxidoreductase [Streptomyces beihaiensis]MCX3058647.1 FAD-dependent oxidoreductase [Streptomyces beihaiensis]